MNNQSLGSVSPGSTELSKEEVIETVSGELEADIILYNGPIFRPTDSKFIEECLKRRRRKNVILLLVTPGGDADAAYRISRCLQSAYERFFLYVSGCCKSAGTLIALGAHELIISDHGELGPLDVQMSKKDELWETQSGLAVIDTLTTLRDNAFASFEYYFLEIKKRSNDAITSKTATELATEMTTGLFSPLYCQVDPLHIGEAGRAMSIASHYGQRLLNKGRNIELNALKFIITAYPSHGFVIDRQEASSLFKQVREPSKMETLLAENLGELSRWYKEHEFFDFLSNELPVAKIDEIEEQKGEDNESGPGISQRANSDGIDRTSGEVIGGIDNEGTVAKLSSSNEERDDEHGSE